MAEKSLSPTVRELAAMPENEFLELCRDTERSESESAFKEVGLDALSAAGQGALATLFALSGSPSAALGAVVSAAFAGVSVWKGMQAIGKGVQSAAQSTSADILLQVLYPPESPGTVITDAKFPGTPFINRNGGFGVSSTRIVLGCNLLAMRLHLHRFLGLCGGRCCRLLLRRGAGIHYKEPEIRLPTLAIRILHLDTPEDTLGFQEHRPENVR